MSGSVSGCFGVSISSKEEALKMQESGGPQEVRSRTKSGGSDQEQGQRGEAAPA